MALPNFLSAVTADLVPLGVDETLLTELRALYREDIALQQQLTGLDLSEWLGGRQSPAR